MKNLDFFAAGEVLKKLPTTVRRLSELKRAIFDNSEFREAYSTLHAGLQLHGRVDFGNTILVTSSRPREGKTTVASGLAVSAALAGQAVLLIDGDLRRPWVGSTMGIADGTGFGEVLDGQVAPADVIHSVEPFGDLPAGGSLSVMSAGLKAPSFLPAVNWPKARELFQTIAKQFNIVILDSPPILAANDALLFASVVDAILLVIGAGSADRDEVLRVKQRLEPTGTPVIGAVLNSFDPKQHGQSHQPHHGYYHDHS